MRKIFISLIILISIHYTLQGQTNARLVVIVTRANWCHACQVNYDKINNDLIPLYVLSKDVLVLVRDITNKKRRKKSQAIIENAGIYDISKYENSTGDILICSKSTGKIIRHLRVSDGLEEIVITIHEAEREG